MSRGEKTIAGINPKGLPHQRSQSALVAGFACAALLLDPDDDSWLHGTGFHI
jgi:hypothetical protein